MSTRTEYITRLRKLADMLEAEPELILPYAIRREAIHFYPNGVEQTAQTARLLPASWQENDPAASAYDTKYYRLTGEWEGVELVVMELRSVVCERVQVGTVEERPVYEYTCGPLLAKAVTERAAKHS